MDDRSNLPVQLSRSELDRIIRRAAELQFQESAGDDAGTLSEDEVLKIGKEVGLEASHVRRALGELRAEALVPQLPPDVGPLKRLVGPGRVRAERVVPGDVDQVEELIVSWLSDVESLDAVRRRAGVSLWEPAEGVVAQIRRGLKWGGQRYELAEAKQVEVSVQGLEDGFSLVTITVDLRNVRIEQGGGAIFGFTLGGAGAAVGLSLAFLTPAAAIAGGIVGASLGGAGGMAIGRSTYQQKSERVRLAAEGLLDRLERGELVKPTKRRI